MVMRFWTSHRLVDLVAILGEMPAREFEELRFAVGVDDAVGGLHVVMVLDAPPEVRMRFAAELTCEGEDIGLVPRDFDTHVNNAVSSLPGFSAARTAAANGTMPPAGPDGRR